LKRRWKYILGVLILGLAGVQFIPTSLNRSNILPKEDIINAYNAPKEIVIILKKSCYDCHSNNTKYTWYSRLQPVRWLMEKHIREGKEELNFNEFASYSTRRQRSKLRSITDQIKDGEMPLKSYLIIHGEAKLSKVEKAILIDWAGTLRDSI